MLKATLKTLLAHSCRLTGVLGAHERRQDGQLTILCFHRVLPEAQREAYFSPVLAITPEAFETICATLAASELRVLPLHEAVQAYLSPNDRGRIVAFTFDDGYRDNAIYAAPILKRHGLRASFYVVSDLIGTSSPPWYDRMGRVVQELRANGEYVDVQGQSCTASQQASAEEVVVAAKALSSRGRRELLGNLEDRLSAPLEYPEPDRIMDWSHLASLQKDGHEIGSHSCSHEILPLLSDKELHAEIHHSKAAFDSKLSRSVETFCYPNGDFDARCLQEVESAGYSAAVTTMSGCNASGVDRFQLRRIFVHPDTWAGPSGKISPTWVRMVTAGLASRLIGRNGDAE
jgi:peptidoglycan/xylan/chitin deacetylase (PgdA/CDA1 family)